MPMGEAGNPGAYNTPLRTGNTSSSGGINNTGPPSRGNSSSGGRSNAGVNTLFTIPGIGAVVFPIAGYGLDALGGRSHVGDPRNNRAGKHSHKGQDIFAPRGTPIVAPVSGRVVKTGYGKGAVGFRVTIQDAQGNYHLLAHMEPSKGQPVREGQWVQAGTVVGFVGSSTAPGVNNETSPHLHYSINEGYNKPLIDAYHFLKNSNASTANVGADGGINVTTSNAPGYPMPEEDRQLSREEALEEVADEFPALLGYLNIPGVADILVNAINGGHDVGWVQSKLQELPWWKETTEHRRIAGALKNSDPATYDIEVRNKAQEILDVYAELGLNFGETLEDVFLGDKVNRDSRLYKIAESYYLADLSGNMLRSVVVGDEDKNLKNSALVGQTMAELATVASEFLVRFSDEKLLDMAKQIVSGRMLPETWLDMVRDQAISTFSYDANIVDQIKQGVTPGQMFDSHKMAVSELLEMDPESMDMLDPEWYSMIDFIDDSGKRRSMTTGEARNWARTKPQYMKTQNAINTATNVVGMIRQKWGV